MFAKHFTLSSSSADMNYIYFFVNALYTVTKRLRKQDHSTVSKTHKVRENNPSNQVKIISTNRNSEINRLTNGNSNLRTVTGSQFSLCL